MSKQVLYDPTQYRKVFAVVTRVPVFACRGESYAGLEVLHPSYVFEDGQHLTIFTAPYKCSSSDVLSLLAYEGAYSAQHITTYRTCEDA